MTEQAPSPTTAEPAAASAESTVVDLERLKSYTRVKQAIAAQVRQLHEILEKRNHQSLEGESRELMVKLAEDRFTLAVLGQFKRGKSSLMNAIIGRDLLPTGVLPLTSAITVLRFGPKERLVIQRAGWSFAEEVAVGQLADYVTEKGNPGNAKGVKTACLELPLPFLRRGLEFVDTPGVGSSIEANTATTYGFLPQCDAVLFVTSVESPLTAGEVDFLRAIRQYVGKIFFVANKTDLLADGERQQVLEFITEAIRTHTGAATVRLFSVSALVALRARLAGQNDGYAGSGLKDLEQALVEFLADEKSETFLAAVADKAIRIVDQAKADINQRADSPRQAAATQGQPKSEWADPAKCLSALAVIRAKLLILHYESLGQTPPESADLSDAPATDIEEHPRAGILPAPADADIANDLRTRGCPVCRRMVQAAFKFFSHWQYELASSEQAGGQFAAEWGFCPLHTWQLAAISSPQGGSRGLPPLAQRVSDELAGLAARPDAATAVRAIVRHAGECRVCRLLRAEEDAYIGRLADLLRRGTGRYAYGRSQTVCLRHLAMLAESGADDGLTRFLLTESARRFEELAEDMQAFALKHDAIRRGLQNADEQDAWRRTLVHLAGEANVCIPWNPDAEV